MESNFRIPSTISSTCCHGRVAPGFLSKIFFFLKFDKNKSGTTLDFSQSPPPIIFPALIIKIFFFF